MNRCNRCQRGKIISDFDGDLTCINCGNRLVLTNKERRWNKNWSPPKGGAVADKHLTTWVNGDIRAMGNQNYVVHSRGA